MATQTFTDELQVVECSRCAITFAITAAYYRQRRNDHANFYCPAGHSQYYPQESEAERLRNMLEQRDRLLAGVRDERDQAEGSLRAMKGHVTRLKRRIVAGACPACSQRFPDLEAHLADAHPGYVAAATE